jgi:hypothetical protein
MSRATITPVLVPFSGAKVYAGRLIEHGGELINAYTGDPYVVANSSTIKAGDFVSLVGGFIKQLTDGEATTPHGTNGTDQIVGIALESVTAAADNQTVAAVTCRVETIIPDAIYEMNLYTASATTYNPNEIYAYTGLAFNVRNVTATTAASEITYGTALNVDATSVQRCVLLGLKPGPTLPVVTATYPRVLVKFMPLACNGSTGFYHNLQFGL